MNKRKAKKIFNDIDDFDNNALTEKYDELRYDLAQILKKSMNDSEKSEVHKMIKELDEAYQLLYRNTEKKLKQKPKNKVLSGILFVLFLLILFGKIGKIFLNIADDQLETINKKVSWEKKLRWLDEANQEQKLFNYTEDTLGLNLELVYLNILDSLPFYHLDLFEYVGRTKKVYPTKLQDFYLGKYKVTQKQWEQVMGYNPSYYEGCDSCPVENISWNEAQAFIDKLNRITKSNYRLPSEAEWVYAARERGLWGNPFFFSKDSLDKQKVNDLLSIYNTTGRRPNTAGICQLHDYVYEWCADDWKSSFDPPGNGKAVALSKEEKVIRWGDIMDSPDFFYKSTGRLSSSGPSHKDKNLSFRLARDVY
jgi:hypothetical protein